MAILNQFHSGESEGTASDKCICANPERENVNFGKSVRIALMPNEKYWFPIRATHHRAQQIYDKLVSLSDGNFEPYLPTIRHTANSKTGEQFVIIMDEYDVLIREEESDEVFLPYLEFLNGLFKNSTLKPAIAMAYLTGILPIVRDKVESKLNEFIEFTILNPSRFAEFTGFTMDETKSLCDKYSMVVLVGIKYHPDTHDHECVIEKIKY